MRALRTQRGLSTRALARRSAAARTTIQRLERGQLRPRRTLLSAVAMGIDPDRQKEILEQIATAAGESVAPDTDGTRRWRRRRIERGILAGEVPLPAKIARRLALHQEADRLWLASMALLDKPGALDSAEMLDESIRLHEESRRLREAAGPPISLWIGRHRITRGWNP